MHPENSFRAAQAYLVASARSRQDLDDESGRPRPFLTISRQAGAGGHALAECLVEQFNARQSDRPWALFDENLVQAVLEEHDLPANLARYLSEKKVAELTDFVEVGLGLHPHTGILVGKMNATIIALAKIGHVVLVGRGAHVLTRPFAAGVHVRLIASEQQRCACLARIHGLDDGAARGRLKELDAGRRAYVKQHFGEDLDDPMAYDMVLNTTDQPVEALAKMLRQRLDEAVTGERRLVQVRQR